jgi:hypothetical protein
MTRKKSLEGGEKEVAGERGIFGRAQMLKGKLRRSAEGFDEIRIIPTMIK